MQQPEQYSGTMIADMMGLVDTLTYASYKANRLRSPEVTPERWALIYHTVYEMEERFQKENTIA
jgi:hypothetical protein